MGLRNTELEYGSVAKWLHWLVAIGVFVLIWLGLQQADMQRSPERDEIRALHASIALGVFTLMSLRLVWRWTSTTPAHPADLPSWQRRAATLVHAGLYVAVFVQLAAGAMTVATNGNPLPFFGLFAIPLPVAESEANHEFWEGIHEVAWIAVLVLAVVHVAAALYNHFVRKNAVLRRMTIGLGSGSD